MGRKFKFYAPRLSLEEKREIALLAESIFDSVAAEIPLTLDQTLSFRMALASLLSALSLDLGYQPPLVSPSSPSLPPGQMHQAALWFDRSLGEAPSFATIARERALWAQQRSQLSLDQRGHPLVHFYTVASANETELQNLQRSARLAGIELKVPFPSLLLSSERWLTGARPRQRV
jgi:hypothetical protein